MKEKSSDLNRKQRIDRVTRLMRRFRMELRLELWKKISLLPALENNGVDYISRSDLKNAIFGLDDIV